MGEHGEWTAAIYGSLGYTTVAMDGDANDPPDTVAVANVGVPQDQASAYAISLATVLRLELVEAELIGYVSLLDNMSILTVTPKATGW
jgi:hypothetical protein